MMLLTESDMRGVAVSQVWRCAKKNHVRRYSRDKTDRNPWFDCNVPSFFLELVSMRHSKHASRGRLRSNLFADCRLCDV